MSDLTVSTSILTSAGGSLTTETATVKSVNKASTATLTSSALEKMSALQATEKQKATSEQEVDNVIDELNTFMQSMQRNLSFTIDEELGQAIISVKDGETEEVIRQIPSEELVVLRKKMDDVAGILFDTEV
ncbi:hypothetical protein GCM10007916_04850 [Psychromonas marina]|uniref:Flagellar protein FlaG n=1 Tax=Psychromonas marina TaxID=88364 RepID=A0ABQ6DW97_9GAMM|nr:flagellar protein FlaG [Psychromonas marina]GLS89418.1 hypothetical protein GCM10007916_04850 [Psychromonas marina]